MMLIGCLTTGAAKAQHQFRGTSLSEALIALDNSSKRYDISFLYDELEDFTVTKNIRRGSSLPEAVREVCGFYPVKVTVKGHDILVECIQKDRTKLIGKLTDVGHQPIAYANILLFSPSDSTVLGGGVSNEAGDFVIPCSASEAKVRISCVGYRTIERTLPIGNVGTIRMQVANNYLGAVTVSGQVPVVRNETDRLTYVVRHDQFAHELTAMEVLNRVPMVSVTAGRASILGKGEAHFMLNGRIVEQGGETIRQKLWSMRAEDIERIEVISVPSGKYQTEGGGFINIVLNPAQAEGWRADVSGQATKNDGYTKEHRHSKFSEQLNASLSYGSRKLDFSLDVHQNKLAGAKQSMYDYTNINMRRYGLHTASKLNNRRMDNNDNNVGVDLMLRYRPVKRLELGAMLSGQSQRLEIDCGESGGTGANPFYASSSNLMPVDPAYTISLTTYGDWKLDEMGKKLSLTYNYFHRKSFEELGCWSYGIEKASLYFIENDAESKYQLHDAKLDLALPFRHFQMDAGVAYTDLKSPSLNRVGNYYNFYSPNYEYTGFDYQERTVAGYLTLQKDFFGHRLSAKAGLRFERTWLKGKEEYESAYIPMQVRQAEEHNRTYNEFLPTLHLNYRLGGHHQLSLAYGIGINRPNLHDLNPLRFYTSNTNYVTGNPSLLHGKTRSLELSYSNGRGFYAMAYHHRGENQVEWITDFYLSPLDTLGFSQENYPINSTNYKKTGLNLRYQHRFSSRLSATAEGEAFYYDAEAPYFVFYRMASDVFPSPFPTYADVHYKSYPYSWLVNPSVNGWGGRLALSGDLFLNQKHTWMVSARYDQWLRDYQGVARYDAYGYFSFAVRCSLLRDRLKLSLVATDPFHQYVTTSHRSFVSDGGSYSQVEDPAFSTKLFDERIHINHHLTNLSLTATYSLFNHTKVNYKK